MEFKDIIANHHFEVVNETEALGIAQKLMKIGVRFTIQPAVGGHYKFYVREDLKHLLLEHKELVNG